MYDWLEVRVPPQTATPAGSDIGERSPRKRSRAIDDDDEGTVESQVEDEGDADGKVSGPKGLRMEVVCRLRLVMRLTDSFLLAGTRYSQ